MLPGRAARIVVVEDDPGMREAIEQLFAAKGYETSVFESAESGLASEAIAGADCYVFDVHLTGMSGHDLRDELARRGSAAPVVLISADDKPAYRDRARKSGATFLAKPFQGRELLAIVAQALEGSRRD